MPDNDTKQSSIAPADAKVTRIPGVKMSVTVGREVIVRVPGVAQSYHGRVVGYDAYEYIIISVRLPSSVRTELATGGQIVLKYFHKGTVYGFKTFVIDAIRSPAPLVFVDYPGSIEKIELRRDTRSEVNIDGELHTIEGQYECLLVNLSTTGCKLSVRATAKEAISSTRVDDTMVVSFSLGTEGQLKLPVAVRNVKREQGIITLGAMFIDLNEKEVAAIANHLDKVRRLTR